MQRLLILGLLHAASACRIKGDTGAPDEDCSWYGDNDGDTHGDAATTTSAGCDSAPSGYVASADDCDDAAAATYPGAAELCDEADNDCDGEIDEDATDAATFWADVDGDGYGDPTSTSTACEVPEGSVDNSDDCDDGDAAVFPGAEEACDGVDNDCDEAVDEGVTASFYGDADADGYGDPAIRVEACAEGSGFVADDSDCNDGDAGVNPGADELCDAVDNDCDGDVDEDDAVDASTWFADADADGFGSATATTRACEQPSGFGTDSADCDDHNVTVHPAATELCDAVDNDCDGTVDEDDAIDTSTWYGDGDGDGYGDLASASVACTAPAGSTDDATDCDDGDAAINPGADELCDGVDNDCDDTVDEDDAIDADTWHADNDGDGYGDIASPQRACEQPTGTVADASDCDDGDASLNPASVWYLDYDSDGYGDASYPAVACVQPSHHVADASDCDDLEAGTHPGASEICDGIDQNCDGSVDEGHPTGMMTWYADADLDGYGDPGITTDACTEPSGYIADATDCDDSDPDINPDAEELCNGLDDDCDGVVDPVALVYGDAAACAASSCDDVLIERSGATDGSYWLDPEGTGAAIEAWCEMDLLGGGWLAVYNMMERDGNNTEAANMHASLIVNDDMAGPVMPDSTSDAIYTANIPLADYSEVLYGWAPSDLDDVTAYGTYSDSGGLEGECYLDGYCGAGVAVATFSIEPTGSSITIYTGNSPTYPHVGLGWSGQIICWGYDNNDSSYGHWANWYDTKSCCTSGNTADIQTPGWRYTIYIR